MSEKRKRVKNAAGKGHAFEREIERLLNEARVPGLSARRNRQGLQSALAGEGGFLTGRDAPDVTITIGNRTIHAELKRCEKLSMPQWVRQAKTDAQGTGRIPAIIYKQNYEEPRIDMGLNDFIDLLRPPEPEPEPERDDLPF